MSPIAVDTSVAVPLLVQRHAQHGEVHRWWSGRELALSGHALVETYAVLTRLPGDLRLSPADADRLVTERFASPLVLSARSARTVSRTVSRFGIAGGAVYDALVALAALEHGAVLATRDARARDTYATLGVRTEVVG